jgi:hypothetical protein
MMDSLTSKAREQNAKQKVIMYYVIVTGCKNSLENP